MATEGHTWLAELCAALVEECGRHGVCLSRTREVTEPETTVASDKSRACDTLAMQGRTATTRARQTQLRRTVDNLQA